MRRINALVTIFIMLLFLVHLVWGGLILFGMVKGGSPVFVAISYVLISLICVHVMIGIALTADTVRSVKKSGVFYIRENALFLTRRISGLALVMFMAVHIFIFTGAGDTKVYRLKLFDTLGLVSQVMMVVSLLLHLATNINPLRIALGLSDKADFKMDIIITLSILLLLSALAFIVYFLRWRVI